MPNVSEGKTLTIIAAQRMAQADALNCLVSRIKISSAITICERATVKAGLSVRRHLIEQWAPDVARAYIGTYALTEEHSSIHEAHTTRK